MLPDNPRNENQTTGAYCLYPPRLADSVDVTEQEESGASRFLVRNRATGRYFLLQPVQYQIFQRIDGLNSISEIAEGTNGTGPKATRRAAANFLTKLDSLELLARAGSAGVESGRQPELYRRFKLFNPNRFLTAVDRSFGWALSRPALAASFVLMAVVTFGMLLRSAEVAAYTSYIYTEYGLVTIIGFVLAIATFHEMAHGLACKHFGGDVPEAGFLMIYYVMPAFYCNVTDMYRFRLRSQRLWVIAAGIYWQLSVSAAAALVWLMATPATFLADFAFLTFLAGTFNVLVNCNPLIKLDGYYALSQLAGVPNLQSRSSAYVKSLIDRLINGPSRKTQSEMDRRALYAGYWILSVVYSGVLIWLILAKAGGFLMDWLGFLGVTLTLALALLFGQRFLNPLLPPLRRGFKAFIGTVSAAGRGYSRLMRPAASSENGVQLMSAQVVLKKVEPDQQPPATAGPGNPGRRRLIKVGVAVVIAAILIAPWEASAGSDCTLELPPGRENSVRANVDAVLAEVDVLPGDVVAEGTKIARLKNPDLEDRLTQLNAQITQLDTRNSQIEDELRVRSEDMLSADFQQRQSQRLASELKAEADQIAAAGKFAPGKPGDPNALPASIAVLQSDVELKQVELAHNRSIADKYKGLYQQGLVGAIQYDTAENAAKVSEKELQAARARLEAALVDHRRLVDRTETTSLVAETQARSARSNFESLITELHSNRDQLEALKERRNILQREYDGMNVLAPRSGVILGEDLRKAIGSHYAKGQEIYHIGELEKFTLMIDVSERDIASVRIDSAVRFKMKTIPGRTFTGRVSKIKAESTTNQYGQRVYPVEVMVNNEDGLLRPGMTGFARISFGRESIGLILAHKAWQALRPELWLF